MSEVFIYIILSHESGARRNFPRFQLDHGLYIKTAADCRSKLRTPSAHIKVLKSVYNEAALFFGAQGERVLAPIRDAAPVVAEFVGPMPYPALNSAFDALLPRGLRHYWKTTLATELSDEAISAHLEHGPKIPTVNSALHIYAINGAAQRVAPEATAFAHRDATFLTNIAGVWSDPADDEANIKWARDYYAALAPHSLEGGYINFQSGDDQSRIRANYGDNYGRLVEIKKKYDPDNLFHLNQNISPTGSESAAGGSGEAAA
jgi:FAD/FMN-containing dehydrogenase